MVPDNRYIDNRQLKLPMENLISIKQIKFVLFFLNFVLNTYSREQRSWRKGCDFVSFSFFIEMFSYRLIVFHWYMLKVNQYFLWRKKKRTNRGGSKKEHLSIAWQLSFQPTQVSIYNRTFDSIEIISFSNHVDETCFSSCSCLRL